jgi:uncharacterized protein (DUF433 family)
MAFVVYWARLKEHDDPYSEGYVGMSSDFDERKKSHYKTAQSSRKRNVHFHNALLKYDGKVIWEVMHSDLTEDEAFAVEEIYREDINIGWNTDKGGVKAVSPEWYADEANKEMHRQATAEATRKRIAEVDSPEARAARARDVWADDGYRKSREGLNAGERNPQFGKFGENHPSYGHIKTPEGRAAISAAMKGRLVTADTRAKIADSRSKVTDKVRSEMYARRMKGEQPKKIAKDYNCNAAYVIKQLLYWREKNELPVPPPIVDWEVSEQEMDRLTSRGEKAMASKFTDAQRRDICKRRAKGETYTEIGKSYGKVFSTIANICKVWGPENGYPFKKIVAERKQKFTKKQKIEMCKRRTNNETFEDIAKDYDANFQAVHYVCSRWGPSNGFPFKKTHE